MVCRLQPIHTIRAGHPSSEAQGSLPAHRSPGRSAESGHRTASRSCSLCSCTMACRGHTDSIARLSVTCCAMTCCALQFNSRIPCAHQTTQLLSMTQLQRTTASRAHTQSRTGQSREWHAPCCTCPWRRLAHQSRRSRSPAEVVLCAQQRCSAMMHPHITHAVRPAVGMGLVLRALHRRQ